MLSLSMVAFMYYTRKVAQSLMFGFKDFCKREMLANGQRHQGHVLCARQSGCNLTRLPTVCATFQLVDFVPLSSSTQVRRHVCIAGLISVLPELFVQLYV
jgi:hypothetical protein